MSITTKKLLTGGKFVLRKASAALLYAFIATFIACPTEDEGGGSKPSIKEDLLSIEITHYPDRRLYAKPSEAQPIGGSAPSIGEARL